LVISLKHSFTSPIADDHNPNEVGPDEWNAEHVLVQATSRLLGRLTGGDGATEELTAADVKTFLAIAISDVASLQAALDAKQPLDSDLTAIAALTTTSFGRGLLELANATALAALVDSFFLTPAEGNAAYQPLDSDLTAIAGISPSNDDVIQRKSGAWVNRTLAQLMTDLAALGTGFQPLDSDLTAIAALTTTSYGRAFLALADATAARAAIGAVIGTNVQAFDADLSALAANSTDGFWAHTGAGTGAARTLTAPAAGITISNPAGIAGNPAWALANDLAALEALASTGLARRTGTDAWSVGTTIATAEITDDAVTYAKLQNVSATSRMLGRKTASAGDAEELTLSEALDFIGSAASGDILYRGASTWSRLAKGSDGQVLTLASGFPSWAAAAGGRTTLVGATTYYVRTDGSDSNNGLANTSGGAFLTITKALAVAGALDCGPYQLTISVQAGTFTAALDLPVVLGSLVPILTGVGATTIISTGASNCITSSAGAKWQVNSMKLTNTSAVACIQVSNGSAVNFDSLDFGSATTAHMYALSGSFITATGNYAVSGGAAYHILNNGYVVVQQRTITYSNSPAFFSANFYCSNLGYLGAFGMTFTNGGTVTGKRYEVNANGVMYTNAGGASYFPGNSAGSAATGGQYT